MCGAARNKLLCAANAESVVANSNVDYPAETTLALIDRLAKVGRQCERYDYITLILRQVFNGQMSDETLLATIQDLEVRDKIDII